ncbi:MAG: DEAD/DEAH box helicase [Firmicutes bacterium]|nr:DEAD/DEAH box helicase [Bacillota bacterium]
MTILNKILQQWKDDPSFMSSVTRWEIVPAKEGRYREFPDHLQSELTAALEKRGIEKLFSHQYEAIDAVNRGDNVVVVTPTASGKTLCYNLPVVSAMINDPTSRALYLFPTKALSQDQVAELRDLTAGLKTTLNCHTYDGDTEPGLRQGIRHSGHIVVTNPDMLHAAILPHHTKWIQLFQNLKYIVIDEMHQYRGVFGSHVANVIRRLKRICAFYGSNPRFILCSATIANPGELATLLIEEPQTVIIENGAPQAEKHFIFYNPPLVNPEQGIRRSSLLDARHIAAKLIQNEVQTIVFTRSRLGVEVLLTYLRQGIKNRPGHESGIRGYRGGYLPRERREIEKGLRNGDIKGVVSTNALELGIDIGALDACVMTGYPGSIASTWQQAGRSGRRSGQSLAVLVANSEPLNQYIVANPDYFFGRTPERALADPDNLTILTNHVRCAAFELPFDKADKFGRAEIKDVLQFLEDGNVLYQSDGRYHWMEDSYPAEVISLRSATMENVVITDISGPSPVTIGEVDRFSAPMLVHEEAIYMHGGRQFQVEKLDFAEKKAFVRPVDVNYYTDANLSVDLRVLAISEEEKTHINRAWGDVRINALVSMFKKIRFNTHENLGAGPVDLPETEMHTTAFWIAFEPATLGGMLPSAVQAGLLGLTHLIPEVSSLYLMSDPRDLRAVSQVKAPFTELPTLFLYDNFPSGVGYSKEIYRIYRDIFRAARSVITDCRCIDGCPSCIGPAYQGGGPVKQPALQLLEVILK